jgi:hypothetical protein
MSVSTSQQIDRVAWIARALDDVRDVLEAGPAEFLTEIRPGSGSAQLILHQLQGEMVDACRVADAFGFTKFPPRSPAKDGDAYVHHRWSGELGGFATDLVWLEPIPKPLLPSYWLDVPGGSARHAEERTRAEEAACDSDVMAGQSLDADIDAERVAQDGVWP